MRLVITGGGTGGHVFPALEVARMARDRGHELLYLGSLRGQEGAACLSEGIAFQGFPSEPLYSLKSWRGIRAGVRLLSATFQAKRAICQWKPDALFSTGGYSAGPVVSAARSLGVPYVLFEANSVPGRSNSMFARRAEAVATVFKATGTRLSGARVVRTGMPIRAALRTAAASRTWVKDSISTVLVVGGSQGSEFLNRAVPNAAAALGREEVHWVHITGKSHFEEVKGLVEKLGVGSGANPKFKSPIPNYEVLPFLEADQMAEAYGRATLVVGRSGGSLAEMALFGLPSVLVPLPSAAGDHQTQNADEFVKAGAAILHEQRSSTPEKLAADIAAWLDDPDRRQEARDALKQFDVPDATEKIMNLIEEAAR